MADVKFKDLSFWLKVAVVGGIISILDYVLSFILGVIYGFGY